MPPRKATSGAGGAAGKPPLTSKGHKIARPGKRATGTTKHQAQGQGDDAAVAEPNRAVFASPASPASSASDSSRRKLEKSDQLSSLFSSSSSSSSSYDDEDLEEDVMSSAEAASPRSPLRSSLKKKKNDDKKKQSNLGGVSSSSKSPRRRQHSVTFNPAVDFSDGKAYPKSPSVNRAFGSRAQFRRSTDDSFQPPSPMRVKMETRRSAGDMRVKRERSESSEGIRVKRERSKSAEGISEQIKQSTSADEVVDEGERFGRNPGQNAMGGGAMEVYSQENTIRGGSGIDAGIHPSTGSAVGSTIRVGSNKSTGSRRVASKSPVAARRSLEEPEVGEEPVGKTARTTRTPVATSTSSEKSEAAAAHEEPVRASARLPLQSGHQTHWPKQDASMADDRGGHGSLEDSVSDRTKMADPDEYDPEQFASDPMEDLRIDVRDLKAKLNIFAMTYFDFEMSEEQKSSFSLSEMTVEYPHLMRYVNYIADGSKYGWDKFFIDRGQRSHLVAALVGKVLETHVLDHTYFGADDLDLLCAHELDLYLLNDDAFERVGRRTDLWRQRQEALCSAQTVEATHQGADHIAKAIQEHLLTPLLSLRLPQYEEITAEFDNIREQSQESLKSLVFQAGNINNKIRLANMHRTDRKPIVFVWRSIPKLTTFNPDEQSCKNQYEIKETQGDGNKLLVSMSVFPALYAYHSVKAGKPDRKQLNGLGLLSREQSGSDKVDRRSRSRRSSSPSPEASRSGLSEQEYEYDRGYSSFSDEVADHSDESGYDPDDLVPGVLETLVARAQVLLVWSSPPAAPRIVQGPVNNNVYDMIVPFETRLYRKIGNTTAKVLDTFSPTRIQKSYRDWKQQKNSKSRLIHDPDAHFVDHGSLLAHLTRDAQRRVQHREKNVPRPRRALSGRVSRALAMNMLLWSPWVIQHMGWSSKLEEAIGEVMDRSVKSIADVLRP